MIEPIRVTGLISPYPIVVRLTNENHSASGMLINKLLFGSDVVSFSAKKMNAPNKTLRIISTMSRRFRTSADLLMLSMITRRPG